MSGARSDRPWPGRALQSLAGWTAAAAGAFCLVVLVVVVWSYLPARRAELLDSPELAGLRETIGEQPDNEALRRRFQQIDVQLRREYFRRSQLVERGRLALLVGAVALAVSLGVAERCRWKLPMPAHDASAPGRDARAARWARRSVAALAAVVCGGAIALAALLGGLPLAGPTGGGGDPWPRFRGPGGAGVSAHLNLPTEWNGRRGKGVLWRVPVPLPGHSSPILWGRRVFLTGATDRAREVFCFDADTGRMLWRRAVSPADSPDETPDVFNDDDAILAASTPVTDGERVVAMFANGDIAGFDMNGGPLWSRALGPLDNVYGHASSLTMAEGRVIVQLDQAGEDDELSVLLALDADTGRTLWQVDRPVGGAWTSPIVIEAAGRKQIIACGDPLVIAHDLADGSEIWRAKVLGPDVAPSPIYAGGRVMIIDSGYKLLALRPDGRGDVTGTHVAWKAADGIPDITSPVSDGQRVYVLFDGVTCYDVRTGAKLWEWSSDEKFQASPSLAGDTLYLLSEDGVMTLLRVGARGKRIGRAELGEKCFASPAFADGRIYIRGEKNLYCIGGKNG